MIFIKSEDEIKKIRAACRIAAEVLEELKKMVKPGISTLELDEICEGSIRAKGALPAFKGYRGYRHATCISINEEVVHGIPGGRRIKDSDIVGLDVGTIYQGYYGDNAATVIVGKVDKRTEKLVKTTELALNKAIEQAKAGHRIGDISSVIEACAKKEGFSVVRDLYGHGVGRALHEDPLIPNFGKAGEGVELKDGMTIAIEPMLNMGASDIETLDDGWTVVTRDKGLSAHFEHTLLINGDKPEVLTRTR